MSVSRKTQKTDVIYVTPGAANGEPESVFFTPDGEGRIWFDTVEEAEEQTGITEIVYLEEDPEEY